MIWGENEAKLETAIQLARAIAHEFRQPMTILNLISNIAELDNVDNAMMEKSISKIPAAVDRLNKLVDSLLGLQEIKTVQYKDEIDIIDIAKSAGNESSWT